jgi:hypothetical protein
VSHSKERKEKICLNCNAELNGRFCHLCGQENLEPKETVWGLISHFFYDITHFDGKFFSTGRYLLTRPGFLTKEYLKGRRASYLNPIKMYVFTSALFFIIFYAMFDPNKIKFDSKYTSEYADSTRIKIATAKQLALRSAAGKEDSARILEAFQLMEKMPVSRPVEIQLDPNEESDQLVNLAFAEKVYKTREQYDSAQKARPSNERDGWFKRRMVLRSIDINNKYKQNGTQLLKDILNKFLHTFPYLLFVSLPLYALFLKLLYVRRKRFYYVDHGLFLVHLYIFTFLVLLFLFALVKLQQITNWGGWILLVQILLVGYGIAYTLKAMRNFYEQRWGRTIVKFMLLNFLAFISLFILFSLFFMLTVMNL